MNVKSISLVVPVYKQENTVIKNIQSLDSVLRALPYKYELIVVVDGFLDRTFEKAKKLESKMKNLKVFGYKKNRGKGHAVKLGILKGNGDVIGFIDGGMDIDPIGISLFLDIMQFHDADIVIGSKLHPESRVDYPLVRRILSWGYRTIIRILFGLSVRDTQVGIKFFKKKVAKDVFPRILVKAFAFDVEVLAIGFDRGYKRIYEAPVVLNFKGVSSITAISFWKIVFQMLWDTLAVFYRLRILKFYRYKNKKKVN